MKTFSSLVALSLPTVPEIATRCQIVLGIENARTGPRLSDPGADDSNRGGHA